MDFSEQLSNYKSEQDTQNDEGVSLLREEENNEQIEQEEIQKGKFNAAYEGTDLSAVGPSADDYDYATEYNDGNTFPTDEENGINLSNKNIKPATRQIAGHDMATGERYTNEYESPLITEAITELQESSVNTKTGAPPKDMNPLSKIAKAMNNQNATYEQFVQNTQGPWSDQQRATAWEGMVKAKQTMSDVKELGKRHFQEAESVRYNRAEGVQADIPETDLVSSPVWIQSGKAVIDYFNPNGSEGMDAQEIHDFNLNLMSNFNFNIPMMMFYANEITNSNDPDLAKSFLYLMDQNEATDVSLASVDRAIGGMMGDISTYLTAGGSVLVSRIAGASMKAGIKQALTKILSVTAVDSAAGGAIGAATDVSGQEIEMAAGEREEIDVGQATKAGAVSAALTATIGVGAATIADPALRKFGVGTVKNAINKINPPAASTAPTPPPVESVTYKSELMREIDSSFDKAKGPNLSIKKLKNKIKNWVNEGKIKMEEVDWAGISDLDPTGNVTRAEIKSFIKHNTPTPSLDKVVSDKFSDMSFNGDGYREYVINIDKTGNYGGPTGHFGDTGVTKPNQANVGHLRMEDSVFDGETGTMFLEGQSDIRKVKQEHTYGATNVATNIKKSKEQNAVDVSRKTLVKQRDTYNEYMLETAKKYNLDPQDGGFNFNMINMMDEEEKSKLGQLMQKEMAAEANLKSAKGKMDVARSPINGEPFTPYRAEKSSNSILFRSAVMEAMNSDSKFLAWPKTREQVGFIEGWQKYGSDFANSDRAKSASEFMTKHMKKLAKNHGFKVEEFTPNVGTKLNEEDLFDEFDGWLDQKNYSLEEVSDEKYILRGDNGYLNMEFNSNKELNDFIEKTIQVKELKDKKFYRIKFTAAQRREWGEKGAAMFSAGAAAVLGVGGVASEQKRNNKGQFE